MKNPVEFSEELQKTELAMFGFSDEFIFEIWGDIGDAKSGRMVKVTQFDEQFQTKKHFYYLSLYSLLMAQETN